MRIPFTLAFAITLAACAPALPVSRQAAELTPPTTSQAQSPPVEQGSTLQPASPVAGGQTPEVVQNRRVEDDREYQFPQLLPFDGIAPVYAPEFVRADQAPLLDDELVIGVVLDGEAKAYPITVLRFREMVDDELGGIPILVTW
jgi:hypothetical protein